MVRTESQLYCRQCQRYTLHARERFGGSWGCLLTLLTAGFFLPVWLLVVLIQKFTVPFRCQACGCGGLARFTSEERSQRRKALGQRWQTRGRWARLAGGQCFYAGAAWFAFLFMLPGRYDRALWRLLGDDNAMLVRFVEILSVGLMLCLLIAVVMWMV